MAGTKKPRRNYDPMRIKRLARAKAEERHRFNEESAVASASSTEPMPEESRALILATLHSALDAISRGTNPGVSDWSALSDMVNAIVVMESRGNMDTAETDEAVTAAMKALVLADERFRAGKGMRMDGEGLRAMRVAIDIYAQALERFTEQEVMRIMVQTSRNIRKARHGRKTETNREVIVL